jgi:hypothetical protein
MGKLKIIELVLAIASALVAVIKSVIKFIDHLQKEKSK